MSEINLRLKTYDELTFEISRLNTDKYLLEQKLQQKENIIREVREYCNNDSNFEIMTDFDTFENHNIIGKDILEILDKVD